MEFLRKHLHLRNKYARSAFVRENILDACEILVAEYPIDETLEHIKAEQGLVISRNYELPVTLTLGC